MFATPSVLALCVAFFAFVDSRVILIQDTPITSEGLSMRIALKEERDASGHPVASIRLIIDDEKPSPVAAEHQPRYPLEGVRSTNEIIPNFDDRIGIGNGRCAIGYVWRGVKCVPQ